MAFNNNDRTHLNRAVEIKILWRQLLDLCEIQDGEWNQLYKSGSDRELNGAGHTDDWGYDKPIGITFDEYTEAMAQAVAAFVTLNRGGVSLSNRERIKDLRQISDVTFKTQQES